MDTKLTLENILRKLCNDNELKIEDETNIVNDLAFDSILVLLFILEIEETFNMEFPDEILTTEVLNKFSTLVKFIDDYLETKSALPQCNSF